MPINGEIFYKSLVKKGIIPKDIDYTSFATKMKYEPEYSDKLYSDMEAMKQQGRLNKYPELGSVREAFGTVSTPVDQDITQSPTDTNLFKQTWMRGVPEQSPEMPELPPIQQGGGEQAPAMPTTISPEATISASQASIPETAPQEPIKPDAGFGHPLGYIDEFTKAFNKALISEPLRGAAEVSRAALGAVGLPKPKREDDWLLKSAEAVDKWTEDSAIPEEYRLTPEQQQSFTGRLISGMGGVLPLVMMGMTKGAGGAAVSGLDYLNKGNEVSKPLAVIANGAKELFSAPQNFVAAQMIGSFAEQATAEKRLADSMSREDYVAQKFEGGADRKEAGENWDKLRNTSEDELASQMIIPGFATAPVAFTPIGRLMQRLSKPAQVTIMGALKTGGTQALEQGVAGAIMNTIGNATAGETYDKTRELFDGLGQSATDMAAIGAILGFGGIAIKVVRQETVRKIASGEIPKENANAAMDDVQKAENYLKAEQVKAVNKISMVENELMNKPESENFFDSNQPHITNDILSMPESVEKTLDKIHSGILVSPEALFEAYQWKENAKKNTLNNKAISDAEKGATLRILSGIEEAIDNSNKEGQKFISELENAEAESPVNTEINKLKQQQDATKTIEQQKGVSAQPEGGAESRKVQSTGVGDQLQREAKVAKEGEVTKVEEEGLHLQKAIDDAKKDNDELARRGDVVVKRNKSRIEANNIIQELAGKAKTTDELYDLAKDYFENKRIELENKFGKEESNEKNEAYDDLLKIEDHVFMQIDGINSEAKPEMAERLKKDKENEDAEFKKREQERNKQKAGVTKVEEEAKPIEVEPVKSEPIEIKPGTVKMFADLESMNQEVKDARLKYMQKLNKAAYRAEAEFTELMNEAETNGMWNPGTREMQGQKLNTDAEAKAWLKDGGIQRIEAERSVAENDMAEAMKAIEELGKEEPTEESESKPGSITLQTNAGTLIKAIVGAPFTVAQAIESKLYTPIATKITDAAVKLFQKGMGNSNKFVAQSANAAQGLFASVGRTSEESKMRRQTLIGGKNIAPLKAADFYNKAIASVNGSQASLSRVHQVLDPEAHSAMGTTPVTFDQLTPQEQKLYKLLRAQLDFIHAWHHKNGFIKRETYDKYKGKYTPRFYTEIPDFELPEDVRKTFNDYMSAVDRSYIKQRKAFEDVKAQLIEDPAYGTAIRMAQLLRNQAILDYCKNISQTNKVSNTEKPGYIKLGGARYGALNNKWVARDIAEDLQGSFFINKLVKDAYELGKTYDSWTVRRLEKMKNTVLDMRTVIGNITTGFQFAVNAGANPVNYATNIASGKAIKSLTSKDATYRYLLANGIMGSQTITAQDLGIFGKAKADQKGIIGKALDKAGKFYASIDDVSKIAAFQSMLEQGVSREQAITNIAESMQNHYAIGRAYDLAAKTPLLGNPYVKFKGDLRRMNFNTWTKRPLSALAYYGLLSIPPALLYRFGDEDEEIKELRENRSYIPKMENMVLDKIPYIRNISNPSLMWQTPWGEINAARYVTADYMYDLGDDMYLSGSDNLLGKAAKLSEMTPFPLRVNDEGNLIPKTQDVLLSPIFNLMINKDFNDKPITDPTITKFKPEGTLPQSDRMLRVYDYLGRSYIPFYRDAADLIQAMRGKEDFYGRNRTLKQALVNGFIKVTDQSEQKVLKSAEKEIDYQLSRMDDLQKGISAVQNSFDKKVSEIEDNEALSEDVKSGQIKDEYDNGQAKINEILEKQAKIKEILITKDSLYQRALSRYNQKNP